MIELYDELATRAIESTAIEKSVASARDLMHRASRTAFIKLKEIWPKARRVSVLCGKGNNGGDGYYMALIAARAGLDVEIVFCGDGNTKGREIGVCLEEVSKAGVTVKKSGENIRADVVVDALLGIGASRELTGELLETVQLVNESNIPVLSIDVPSGLDCDTGQRLGTSIVASATITFITRKIGLYIDSGRDCCGRILFDDLGIPSNVIDTVAPVAQLIKYEDVSPVFTTRLKNSHKGDFGHALVIAGAPGYLGAARLAAEAAVRSGVGLVSVATHPSHAALVNIRQPEIMCMGVMNAGDLRSLLNRCTVIACGPGLGVDDWGLEMFNAMGTTTLPIILDADGLNLLAKNPYSSANRVITPHVGEAARLLAVSNKHVTKNRLSAALELQKIYGGIVVLKGAGTIVAMENSTPLVVAGGNPGMATGGMGDVLTGFIASLKAQGLSLPEAAVTGAVIHSHAGDMAALEGGERGVLASDLFTFIRQLVNTQ